MQALERLLSSSQPEAGEARFLDGTRRVFTRDTWYAREESDFRADDYDEPLDAVRAGPRAALDDVWGSDAFAEGGYRPMVAEQPGVIEQLRRDIASDEVARRVDAARLKRDAVAAPQPERRARAAIIEAMAARNTQQLLFALDFASSVPSVFRDEFLRTLEVESIVRVLGVQLYSTLAGGVVHVRQREALRELAAVGCELVGVEERELEAPLRRHVLAADAALYGALLESEHAHAEHDRHRLRVITVRVPTSNAFSNEQERIERERREAIVGEDDYEASDDDDEQSSELEQADPRGYRVRVVYHVVERAAGVVDSETSDPTLLCFRTFQFSR